MELAIRNTDGETGLSPVALPAYSQLPPLPVKPALLQCGSVDMLNGAHVYACDDLAVDGVVPLIFTTRYWSAWPAHGEHPLVAASVLGHRWSHRYMIRLIRMDGASHVLWDDHRIESFTAASGWQIPYAARPGSRLHDDGSGQFTLTHADCTSYLFDSDGQLSVFTDRHGNTVRLAYDSQRQLVSITDTGSSRTLALTYRNGGLHRVTDPLGRTVTYGRDRNGDLTSVTDPCGHTRTFRYLGASLLASATDGRGNAVFENTYDNGVIVFQRDARALQARAASDPANGSYGSYGTDFSYGTVAVGNRAARLTTGTDRAGNAYSTVTDVADGDCLSRTLALSPGQLYAEYSTYVARGMPSSRTTYSGPVAGYTPGTGNTVNYTYDDHGNCLTEVTTMSRSRIHAVSRTYDSAGNMLTRSIYEGQAAAWHLPPEPGKANTWVYVYNQDNTLRAVRDPLGSTRKLTYWPGGLPHTVADALGNLTTSAYAAGSMVGLTDATGETTAIVNDAIGRPVTVVQTVPGMAPVRADFTYDGNGHELTRITRSPDASPEEPPETVVTTYDGNGNITAIRNAGNHTVHTYNANNRAYAVATCSGHGVERVIELEYDRLDFPLSATLHRGIPATASSAASSVATSHYNYDAMGLMTREVRADGSVRSLTDQMLPMPAGPFSRRSCTIILNEEPGPGSPAHAQHPDTCYAAVVYDPLGRPISVTGRDGRTAAIVHTMRTDRATGSVLNVASATFPGGTPQVGKSRILVRDALGRTVSVTDQTGLTTTFTYAVARGAGPNGSHALEVTINRPGNEIEAETEAGPRMQRIYFDASGQQISHPGAGTQRQLKEIAYGLQACSDSDTEAMNARLFDWLATG